MAMNKEIQLPITIVSKYEKRNLIFDNQFYIVYRIANSNTGNSYVQEVSFNDYIKTFFVYQTYNVTFVEQSLQPGSSIPFINWRRSYMHVSIVLKSTAGSKKLLEKKKLKADIKNLDHKIQTLCAERDRLARKLATTK